ncbi:hypothetical protein SDC9_66225 [bioreactor metagenome]|uniref:Uncharacterized protein n=1 Tax=bioreactor metagenome TaxID=1076179 RepID=A0A644XUP2_9ZZZZ
MFAQPKDDIRCPNMAIAMVEATVETVKPSVQMIKETTRAK